MSNRLRHGFGSVALVSALGIAGKLLGFARSVIVAAAFGTSADLDAFFVAFLFPTILPSVLSGVMTTVFVPYFVGRLEAERTPAAWVGANAFLTICFLLAFAFGVGAAIWAHSLVALIAPGLESGRYLLAAKMTQVLMPLTVIMVANAIMQAIAQCTGRFAIMSLESVLTNVSMLVALFVLRERYGVWSLVVGAVVAFLLNALVLMAGILRTIKDSLRASFAFKDPGFKKLLYDSMPYLLSYGGTWASALISQAFVSGLDSGAISALSFATLLAFLPLETIGNAILTVSYPDLCRRIEKADMIGAQRSVTDSIRHMCFALLPAAILLWLAATPIISVVFQRKAFTAESTAATASVLGVLALAVIPRALTYLGFRALVALNHRWMQIAIGLGGVAVNIALCAIMIPRFGLIGVALATVLSAFSTLVATAALVKRQLSLKFTSAEQTTGNQLAMMGGACALVLSLGLKWTPFDAGANLQSVLGLSGACLIACVAYLAAGVALKNQESMAIAGQLKKFFAR